MKKEIVKKNNTMFIVSIPLPWKEVVYPVIRKTRNYLGLKKKSGDSGFPYYWLGFYYNSEIDMWVCEAIILEFQDGKEFKGDFFSPIVKEKRSDKLDAEKYKFQGYFSGNSIITVSVNGEDVNAHAHGKLEDKGKHMKVLNGTIWHSFGEEEIPMRYTIVALREEIIDKLRESRKDFKQSIIDGLVCMKEKAKIDLFGFGIQEVDMENPEF
ncbi:MAG: hypothetical protein KJO08_00770 [Gammaproteobacteria bacterium]|nr:hypothetical protein [Gammaproteobacteria bacterium]NNJ83981.1 hypothetical protein [Gammaproteobacteria bacterium]